MNNLKKKLIKKNHKNIIKLKEEINYIIKLKLKKLKLK